MSATLLLADDSITIQRVIELTFADEDIRVLVASDGQQAIQKIDSERPDIVLADIGMPRVDGYAVATHVKQSASLKHIPVLLLTGAFEPIDEARARQTGCDGVLVKPFEPQKLVARVKELLNGSRAAELWPAEMPRAQVPLVQHVPQVLQVPAVHQVPAVLAVQQVPAVPAVQVPAVHAVFDLDTVVVAPRETSEALEGEDVANRTGDHPFRQARPALPPPVDRLETELDMLDAALSRLDPTANPQELDEETASDFARDLNELRSEARPDDDAPSRPPRPSFGTWDLPTPGHAEIIRDQPIDVVPEEISLVLNPSPMFHTAPPVAAEPPVETPASAPVMQPPTARVEIAPVVTPPALFVPTPAPVAPPPALVTPLPAPPPNVVRAAPATPAAERPTLAVAFSALLAAEKSRPAAQAAAPQISEAAIEEVVKRVLARMAGDTVNRVVVETAERLIREEISRTKDPSGR